MIITEPSVVAKKHVCSFIVCYIRVMIYNKWYEGV